ncbi:ATP-dependent helicase [Wolbachia endosymbiont of Dirofilaria (Dirofilaria) immitis]|uniref:ATP-dependent helicase n=1 Tax=Wolbachia endosymbiont of Dirofilaria (Dirofilaria) immitis TaxID=1812115 RepID=UPI00158B1FF0|nr:UvrD-helicase domain-containing protein [Wolbachia endosymbiont of Dirofilaria (Dirofilaria) immitis]QKX02506.1 AAA family ATPase [Wolbachia endosymbiont of Dirofilaria (Dirofilaria) immitis]
MEDYFSLLNTEQQLAVTNVNGPVLILAGAGTGKTRTITSRIAHIIRSGYASSNGILAVTFTNKAASEMVSRVLELTGVNIPWLGTFHTIAAKILRRHAEIVGLNSNFTIIGTDDQLQIIKNIINEMNHDCLLEKCRAVMGIIQQWKEKCLLPSEVGNIQSFRPLYVTALKVYNQYQERLKFLNSVDFGDLLLYNIQLFNQNAETLFYYQNKFRYIVVDEYQDTNAIQYIWLKCLAKGHSNICCVGDDDQSIYSWRGAEVGNILKFFNDFENVKTVKLECNYRSTSHILATASYIINHNKARLEKKLWTVNAKGEKVNLIKLWDGKAEARFISEWILKLNKYRFSDIAVLVRAVFQTRVLEEYFMKYSIPYKIISGVKFYERQEVRDIIAYLRLVMNTNDDLAFERIVNRPKRSIGAMTLKKIYTIAQDNKTSFFEAARALVDGNQVTGRIKFSLNDFLSRIEAWKEIVSVKPLDKFAKIVVNQSGYMKMLENEEVIGLTRVENVRELISSLKKFDNITAFLEHISLVMEVDNMNSDDTVYVMTLHAAKGLEFPCVFLPGWEEGLFPHQKSFKDESGRALEEERRLAYVGITRAKEKLIISCAGRREMNNQWQSMYTSRFIKELPRENVEVIKSSIAYC